MTLCAGLDMGDPHQLGDATKIGAGSGGDDFGRRFAPADKGAGIGDFSGSALERGVCIGDQYRVSKAV